MKHRNFSPWAYWSLRLAAQPARPEPPIDAAEGRRRLQALLGPEPARVPLDVETTERVELDHYVRERIVFDTEATMSVPAYLLVPHDRIGGAPGPAVLAIHGHGSGKAAICDGDDTDGQAYAHELACRGFVVLAPDLRCFGERQDPQWDPDGPGKYDCDWNLVCAVMAGVNPIAQNLWDLQRALDVLAEHPLVAPSSIGACGLSYGATMTLFLAAIDVRVRAAVVSGYLSAWSAAHRVPWNMCGSQVMWGQEGALEHLDVAALVAPRPLLVESGTDDPIFPLAAARATVAALRLRYPDPALLEHDVFDGDHRWHGDRAPDFLKEHLT